MPENAGLNRQLNRQQNRSCFLDQVPPTPKAGSLTHHLHAGENAFETTIGLNEVVHFGDFALSSSNQFSTTISLSGALAAGRIIRKRRSSGDTAYCG
jgi:hypothetical protein